MSPTRFSAHSCGHRHRTLSRRARSLLYLDPARFQGLDILGFVRGPRGRHERLERVGGGRLSVREGADATWIRAHKCRSQFRCSN